MSQPKLRLDRNLTDPAHVLSFVGCGSQTLSRSSNKGQLTMSILPFCFSLKFVFNFKKMMQHLISKTKLKLHTKSHCIYLRVRPHQCPIHRAFISQNSWPKDCCFEAFTVASTFGVHACILMPVNAIFCAANSLKATSWVAAGCIKCSLKCTAGKWNITGAYSVWSIFYFDMEYSVQIMPDCPSEHHTVYGVHSTLIWSIVSRPCLIAWVSKDVSPM